MLLVPNPQTNGEFTQTEPSASESEDTVGDVNIVNNSNIVNWLLWFWIGITMKTGGLECGLVGITHKHAQF